MLRRVVYFWLAWLMLLAFSVCLALDNSAHAMIEVKKVYVTYRDFFEGGSDAYITGNQFQPGKELGKELDLTVNSYIFDTFYWDYSIKSLTDEDHVNGGGQFRFVGLDMGLGLDFRKFDLGIPLTLGYHHFSGHTLDTAYPGHFPVNDSIELRIYLLEKTGY